MSSSSRANGSTLAGAAVLARRRGCRPPASRSPARARPRARSPRRRSRRTRGSSLERCCGLTDAADRPDGARLSLDPDHDPLGGAGVVDTLEHPLREDGARLTRFTIWTLTRCGIESARGRASGLPPESLLVPLHPLVEGGADRRLRHPRARARPAARTRSSRTRTSGTAARRAQIARLLDRPEVIAGARRGHGRRAAHDLELELACRRRFSRAAPARRAPIATSQAAIPFDLKTTMSSSACRPSSSPRDHLLQLVHLEPVEHAGFDGLDQVARLEPRLLARVATDERRPLEHNIVELARTRLVRADCAHERTRPQPLAPQNRILGGRDGDDDVAASGVAMRLAPARRRSPCRTRRAASASGSRRPRARSQAAPHECTATWLRACQPQPITPSVAAPVPREVLARPRRSRRPCGAVRACRPRSRRRARPPAVSKSTTTKGVPPGSHVYAFTPA